MNISSIFKRREFICQQEERRTEINIKDDGDILQRKRTINKKDDGHILVRVAEEVKAVGVLGIIYESNPRLAVSLIIYPMKVIEGRTSVVPILRIFLKSPEITDLQGGENAENGVRQVLQQAVLRCIKSLFLGHHIDLCLVRNLKSIAHLAISIAIGGKCWRCPL